MLHLHLYAGHVGDTFNHLVRSSIHFFTDEIKKWIFIGMHNKNKFIIAFYTHTRQSYKKHFHTLSSNGRSRTVKQLSLEASLESNFRQTTQDSDLRVHLHWPRPNSVGIDWVTLTTSSVPANTRLERAQCFSNKKNILHRDQWWKCVLLTTFVVSRAQCAF